MPEYINEFNFHNLIRKLNYKPSGAGVTAGFMVPGRQKTITMRLGKTEQL